MIFLTLLDDPSLGAGFIPAVFFNIIIRLWILPVRPLGQLRFEFSYGDSFQIIPRCRCRPHDDHFGSGLGIHRDHLHGLSHLPEFNINFLAGVAVIPLCAVSAWPIKRHASGPSRPIICSGSQ